MTTRILVVEDDEAIATGLALNLRLAGYAPLVCGDAEEAQRIIDEEPPALVLLDINLPGKTGLDLLADLRGAGHPIPIIVLSARQGEYDKVGALRLGADDYITKPFALAELLARVDAVLRRSGAQPAAPGGAPVTRFADCEVDMATRQVNRAGDEVKLTHIEFELLAFFLRNPSKVFSRERLLRDVWGHATGSPRTVDNFVAQLRAKLEADAEAPRHFVTVRGSGYRFDP
ncbi:MAG TPA: response regulator transcription factor [Kofleriaceae bacterium]|nr:response regulator transcription factor [Kofleriaceae bacterium]